MSGRRRVVSVRRDRVHRSNFDTLEARTLLAVQPISLASSSFYGASANGPSTAPAMSADGQVVAFTSKASNLVAGQTNGFDSNVYVRNGSTGVVSLVSINKDGTASGNGAYSAPIVSADGRFVFFTCSATDLTSKPVGNSQLYVRDLAKGTTTLVSVNSDGTGGGNGGPGNASVSLDGRYVAFEDSASNLVPGIVKNDGGSMDIYVRDLVAGTTTLVSINQAGTGTGSAGSVSPVISGNGRFVVFSSDASDLTPMDTNKTTDVLVRDLQKGSTSLVSINRYGTASGDNPSGGGYSRDPKQSARTVGMSRSPARPTI